MGFTRKSIGDGGRTVAQILKSYAIRIAQREMVVYYFFVTSMAGCTRRGIMEDTMHIPDGYLSPQTFLPLYGVMLPVWTAAARKVQRTLRTRHVPLLALGAAF